MLSVFKRIQDKKKYEYCQQLNKDFIRKTVLKYKDNPINREKKNTEQNILSLIEKYNNTEINDVTDIVVPEENLFQPMVLLSLTAISFVYRFYHYYFFRKMFPNK
jgi:hypothetical protein